MDDCNLDKLVVKPGKLSPVFHRDTTEYHVTLGSNVEKITFECLTSDTGASYCISGSNGGRTVPLVEGQVNDIKVEVSAEDGTTKIYNVHVRRLSAKDATLSDLKISKGVLEPEFSADVTEYYCLIGCDISSVTVMPSVPDTKAVVNVCGEKPGAEIALNIGFTRVEVEVTSPDGSNKQIYKLLLTRKQILRYLQLSDPSLAMQYEDPIALCTTYQPITIKDSDPVHTFSAPIIDELTRTSKIDPINEMPLPSDWRIEDFQLDAKISGASGCIPLTNGGQSEVMKLRELGSILKTCSMTPAVPEAKFDTNVPVKHTLQVRGWEKQLQQIFDETNATTLQKHAEESLQKYYEALPSKPSRALRFRDGESPIDHLEHAIHCYSTAIKNKGKDASLHLQLGLVLEEKYLVEDTLGLKKEGDSLDLPSFNVQAKESSKEEECAAICKLRGVSTDAPLALQLKAIDEEYHHLVDSGQSGKADHVQGLYAWKSKQATQEGITAQKAADEESPLGQAYLKYLDALSLDETKAAYHFHVGRMLVVQGNYEEATKRLEAALGWNTQLQMARFYLGMALALKKDGPGSRIKEAVSYLLEGLELLLQHNTELALQSENSGEKRSCLQADSLLRSSNIHLLRGFIQLGRLLAANQDIKDTMNPSHVFHTTALIASQVLPLTTRGNTYQQLEWVLLEAHSQLLESLLAKKDEGSKPLIAQRCERLSALIKSCTIPQNTELLSLQQKTCQMLVEIQPCNSHALYLLGNAQLTQYDNTPSGDQGADALLAEAKGSFHASISLEGKPMSGDAPSEITEQSWWQDKIRQEKDAKKKAAEAKEAAAPASKPAGGRGAPAAKGGATGRGGGAAGRGGGASGRGGGATGRGGAEGANRGGATAAKRGGRGGAVASRGAPAAGAGKGAGKTAAGTTSTTTKAPSSVSKTGSSHTCKPSDKPGSASKRPPSASKRPPSASKRPPSAGKRPPSAKSAGVPVNKKTYHARLGLARALAKHPDDQTEALKYYNQVIDLAPEVHDAYIESGEMMSSSDPLAAVDVYSRFPVPENPTFDDAYIFGEVVRLLMKAEKYDDPRLQTNLIAMGRVMGIGSLEKYVQKLDELFKTEILKNVYAGVNGKDVDDPDMQAFFKFKCWI